MSHYSWNRGEPDFGQLVRNKHPTSNKLKRRALHRDQSGRSTENPCADVIPSAEDRKLSKRLPYQLKVVNIDYLRDFHAQEAN